MKIIPLSKARLKEAIELVLKCFPESKPGDYDSPEKWLIYSLEMKNKKSYVSYLGYWIVIEDGKVVAITGLYALPDDEKEANWLAWTCVDPKYRQRGIGGKLIDMMIKKARNAGKKFLRLYTDSRENEKVARIIYKKLGFIETRREKDREHGGYTIYLQLRL